MKPYIFYLLLLILSPPLQAQSIDKPIGTDFSYSRSGNEFRFYLYSEFAFGSGGGGGPKVKGYLAQKSHDTIYIKAIYNTGGVWAGWYSYSEDTINYTLKDIDAKYFTVSSNAYVQMWENPSSDTAWNLFDSTFAIAPASLSEVSGSIDFSIFPNPSNGAFTITQTHVFPNAAQRNEGSLHAIVYDLPGRIVYRQALTFSNNTASVKVNAAPGVYMLELIDAAGNTARQRIAIE